MCIKYQSTIRTSCGSGLLKRGMNFSTAWWTMRLINGEKDWKRVSMQKVVTLNTCCDAACLRIKLPSQSAFLRATNVWRKTIYHQSDEQVLHLQAGCYEGYELRNCSRRHLQQCRFSLTVFGWQIWPAIWIGILHYMIYWDRVKCYATWAAAANTVRCVHARVTTCR